MSVTQGVGAGKAAALMQLVLRRSTKRKSNALHKISRAGIYARSLRVSSYKTVPCCREPLRSLGKKGEKKEEKKTECVGQEGLKTHFRVSKTEFVAVFLPTPRSWEGLVLV